MLTHEENELLIRVGPGTPIGSLMRHYWIPVVQSAELEPGGRIKRVKLLGENLVVLRAASGKAGLMSEFCPHRRASLYFGRNEAEGLRCVYHGWQFALNGQCMDMPNEPPESNFQEKVCHSAYPCAERGGVVWTYMGAASPPPPFPDLEWTLIPSEQRFVSKFYQECNYLQALEGGLDPSHISFLHGLLDTKDTATRNDLDRAAAGFALTARLARAPYIDVVDTDYGVLIGAQREADAGQCYWRITQFHMPFYTMPPTDTTPDPVLHSHIWIPVDDENLVNWCVSWHPTRALSSQELDAMQQGMSIHIMDYAPATSAPYGDIRPAADQHNDYMIDWQVQQHRKYFGVPGVGSQDKAITESQEAIFDRTQERLGRADLGIIRVRKWLFDAAVALHDHGTLPAGMAAESFRIRPASVLLSKDVPWVAGSKERLVAQVTSA